MAFRHNSYGESRRGSGSHSVPVLAACCAASVFAGFVLCHQLALPSALPPAVPAEHTPSGSGRRMAMEVVKPRSPAAEDNTFLDAGAEAPKLQSLAAKTYEEAVAASGLLRKRPAALTGESGHGSYIVQPMQLLSLYPRAYLYPGFMDDERADHIVKIAEKRLAPSGLALRAGDTMESQKDVRTSQGTFISRHDDPDGVLAWVEEKIAALTAIPSGHGEPFNVLRYENNQHYASHHDVFSEDQYGPQISQRMVTVLLYLSDVEEGGETVFPLEGADGEKRMLELGFNYDRCDLGLTVKPRKGDALLFYSLHVNGTFDKHSLHGGCPVKKGTKWVATKWIRDKCFSGRC